MEFETRKIITTTPWLFKHSMSSHRRILDHAEVFYVVVVLFCALSILGTCESCSVAALRDQLNCDACQSFNTDVFSVDASKGPASQNLVSPGSSDNVCPDSNLFCFRSTLPGFLSPQQDAKSANDVSSVKSNGTLHARPDQVRNNVSWSMDSGIFRFYSGRTVSCSLYDRKGCYESPCYHAKSEAQKDVSSCRNCELNQAVQHLTPKDDGRTRQSRFSFHSSPHVEISPSLLDWGQKYLYFPSLAFVTIRNIHSENILTVYEPYSMSSQFYPCNCSEILLEPGEIASICFVFLPTFLGSSSTQLVLQTSSGGFLVHATGLALESPYKVPPLVGLDVASGGKWRKSLSLFNPYNEALQVEEVAAVVSVSSRNTSQFTKALCTMCNDKDQGQFSLYRVEEWIDIKVGEVGLPVILMKPHENWQIAAQKNGTIMELEISFHSRSRVSGAFCVQLLRSSREKDTIMVPFEAEFGKTSYLDKLPSPISLSLEALVPCEISGTSVSTISLRSDAPYMLSVVRISVVGKHTKHFHIKYMEGLLLFPGTITHVAVVFYTPMPFEMDGFSAESQMDIDCELVILTNESRNSEIKIPCRDFVGICPVHELNSSVGYVQGFEEVQYGDTRKRYSPCAIQSLLLNEALNTTEADELVLKSWKSQATVYDMSVAVDHEVLFPVVRLGSHSSQFINVQNPSQHPIAIQLILNSGEIIDDCKAIDELFQPSFTSSLTGNKSFSPSRFGFSIPEGALTEAFVHPYGKASLGPIFFQPSNRCVWKSSVLIRNNLSGVEWLSLRGSGGSLSVVLLEDSEPTSILEFKLSLPTVHSLSSLDLLQQEFEVDVCSQPLSKELYVKNMGDLPFEVKRIGVSGSECGLDGFVVQTCKGFVLEPGESIKLKITYQTDFSVVTVQRDLELALTTGIFVIPMKASLSLHMLGFCEKSIYWARVKKSIIAVPLMAFFLILVLCCLLPHAVSSGTRDFLLRSGTSSSTRYEGEPSHAHRNHDNYNKFPLSAKLSSLLSSIGGDEALRMESLGRSGDDQSVMERKCPNARHVNSRHEFAQETKCFLSNGKETTISTSSTAISAAAKSCDSRETTQGGNLSVKTGKDKGRRRRKKKSSGTVVSGLFEVSSSQSGNSTPSSPLSPASSFTPKRSHLLSPDVDQAVRARNPFSLVAGQQFERHANPEPKSKANELQPEIPLRTSDKKQWCLGNSKLEKSAVLHKTNGNPVLLPSTGVPDPLFSCSPILASRSSIAPHARAPGPKLRSQKTDKPEDKGEVMEKFTYDIWGDHASALPLLGTRGLQPHVSENNSDSFFVTGPQPLMTIAQSKSVCSDQVV